MKKVIFIMLALAMTAGVSAQVKNKDAQAAINKVLRADIDYNKHLNNANYVRMAMELLPDKTADGIIVSLSIGSEVSAIIEFT